MRNIGKGILLGLFCAAAAFASPASGAASAKPVAGSPGVAPSTERGHFTAGEEIARTITLTTGVPISPMLGVSALGAWRWWQTPERARASLPWYARPWFWGSGLFLVFLFVANTTIGAAVPGLKKPMDFVEEHENKLSALVATPIVLLEVKRMLGLGFPALLEPVVASVSPLAGSGLALAVPAVAFETVGRLVLGLGLGILYVACFFIVFIAFHAIQVMIALSPSTLLDMVLRGSRLSLLGLLGLSSWIHPYLGAALGFVILFVACFIAGWSFRLTVFGSVLSWDYLSGRDGAADPAHAPLVAFSQRGLKGVKLRSFGRLVWTGAEPWIFRYRPWLILARRSVPIPAGQMAVLKGAISPLLVRQGPLRTQTLLRFPPRFRTREVELAAKLGVGGVLEGRMIRGFRAAWAGLKELVVGTPESVSPKSISPDAR